MNQVLLENSHAMFTYLLIGYFSTTTVDLSSCSRDYNGSPRGKEIVSGPLQGKSADLGLDAEHL